MRKVLIISPRFPPANAADSHRVRLCARYYEKFGWHATILCSQDLPAQSDDDRLFDDVARYSRVIRVKPWPYAMCKRFGFGLIDFRCFFPMLFAGLRLLKSEDFDCVFFSTTAFITFLLGLPWKFYRPRVALVYDFQDPWYHGKPFPYGPHNCPGSWHKYKIMQWLAYVLEPLVLKKASHVMAVSPGYTTTLVERYDYDITKTTVLPFPGALEDFKLAEGVKHSIFKHENTKVHWVYAGRAGPDMNSAIRHFFSALDIVLSRKPHLFNRLEVHFVGTNYAPAERTFDVVKPIPASKKVSAMVFEHPVRVKYLEVLDLYKSADLILMFGSDQTEYSASKIATCLISGRPILGFFKTGSAAISVLSAYPSVTLCTFSDQADDQSVVSTANAIEALVCVRSGAAVTGLDCLLAEDNAAVQCKIFSEACRE